MSMHPGRGRATHVALVTASAMLGSALLPSCGAKSGLRVPTFVAELDAAVPPRPDAGIDARVFPPDAWAPPDVHFDLPDTGPDAFAQDAGPTPPDICIELPPSEPPREITVSFLSQIVSAEVYFLIDVTGSMGEEIEQIRARLRDTIIPGIVREIPDVRFSVGRYADFPESFYGDPMDDVFRLEQASTRDVAAIETALDRITLMGGGDLAECTTEALYLSATGEGAGRYVPPAACPAGAVGYPCFSPRGSRIFLLFTDAPFHNGPGREELYGMDLPFPAHTYAQAVTELNAIGARVLGLYSGVPFDTGYQHLVRVARDTGAVRADGSSIVFDIGLAGSSLGADVVEGIRSLVDEVPIDIDTLVEDGPGDAVDATMFVTGVRAVSADPAGGATLLPDRFVNVQPGTRVTFSIQLANTRFERLDVPQVFRLNVVLRGDGVTRLDETLVDIVVPALDGRGCP